jgi:hypothetical protein
MGQSPLPPERCPLTCYNTISSIDTDPMTRLDVICPSAPWENETTDDDTAWDVCYSLSIEYGYAQIRERVNGTIIGEYRNGQ